MSVLSKRIQNITPSQTLAIAAKARQMKEAGEDVISFGAGEPECDTPAFIAEAAKKAIDGGRTKYTPAAGISDLRRAVCAKFARDNGLVYDPSEIVVSSGAKHSVFNVCFALIDEGDEVIIPAPYWLTYPEIVLACGGVPVPVKTDETTGYKLTPSMLRAAVTPRTKLLILNSPCNPTGAVYSEAEVRAIAAVCEEAGIWTLSDEIYEKFVYGGLKTFSFAACSPWAREHTVTVNGVSKTYAMTGWRIGYLGAPAPVARAIAAFQSHTAGCPNAPAQYAALAALTADDGTAERMVARFAERREALLRRAATISGVTCIVPDGAFYAMLDVSGAYGKRCGGRTIGDSFAFAEALLECFGVAVVPGAPFGAEKCVRIGYSLPVEEILEGLGRIDAFLHSLEW